MPTLTREEVEEIALLARLHLEPDEMERMQHDLGTILEHFSSIAAVPTAEVPPMTHVVAEGQPLRADEAGASLSAMQALAGAPKRDGDLIVVPAIIPGAE